MSRMFLCLAGVAAISLSAGAQEATPSAEIQAGQAVVKAAAMSPEEKLYEQAVSERKAGKPKQAIQTAAKIIALYADDAGWLAKSEMLCAELYLDMGMLDAADVTARQVQIIHKGTASADKADALRSTIEKLRITTNGGTK